MSALHVASVFRNSDGFHSNTDPRVDGNLRKQF